MFLPIILLFTLPSVVSIPSETSCESLHSRKYDVWLSGEVPPVAFATQLLSVYSFVPIAHMLQCSLVLGDLYTFEQSSIPSTSDTTTITTTATTNPITPPTPIISDIKWRKIPFGEFFDVQHLITYWQRHNILLITLQHYHRCFHASYKRPTTTFTDAPPTTTSPTGERSSPQKIIHFLRNITRIPEFFPIDQKTLGNFLFYANSSTLTNNFQFPFENHEFIHIIGRFEMAALYSFWGHADLLAYASESIRPAPGLMNLIRLIRGNLPSEFIAIHSRVDDEAFASIGGGGALVRHHDSDSHTQRIAKMLASYIEKHPCIVGHGKAFPIYFTTNANPHNKMDRKRVKRLMEDLHEMGFTNIKLRKSIIEDLVPGPHKGGSANEGIDASMLINASNPINLQQFQYVDMMISKQSICFIPSMVPSVASYLIKRFMALDKGIQEKYESINTENYGNMAFYRDWGF